MVDLYDCSDFADDEAAQAAFLRAGGPTRDPNDLDRDGDGLACEYHPLQEYRPAATGSPNGPSCHHVAGYYRQDGTYVRGHTRCR